MNPASFTAPLILKAILSTIHPNTTEKLFISPWTLWKTDRSIPAEPIPFQHSSTIYQIVNDCHKISFQPFPLFHPSYYS